MLYVAYRHWNSLSWASLYGFRDFSGHCKEFDLFDAESCGYNDERIQSQIQRSAFKLADVSPMKASTVRQSFLGHAELTAKDFNVG